MATTQSEFFTVSLSSTPRIHALITVPVTTPISYPQRPAPALIFLHYWGGSAQTWHYLPPLLSPPCTTISLSFRGWGQSTGPSDLRGYSIARLANDVLDLLPQVASHLREAGYLLVGHSMGAKVAMAVASQKPPGLRGMVLVGPAPPAGMVLPQQMRERQLRAYESKETVLWAVENVLAEPHNLSKSDLALIVRDSMTGNQYAREAWPRYGMQEEISIKSDRRGMPVMVLVGKEDQVETPESVRSEVVDVLSRKGFRVGFAMVEDCGHLMPLEKPEIVAQAIRKLINEL